ncbi:hypothetical protein ACFYVR_13520 [Rhodococcus sp. NPDC003318]|uniref:hypothetical protein n=1 Tax=Rhodococcus sp. NPDC003318 TaxID=3364503 RepID=UPI003678FEEB
MNDTVHPTADTSTESCGYTLTEDGETALDVFQRRVDESQAAATVDAEDKSLFPNPRPAWSLPEWDSHSTAPAQSTMRSEEIVIPLRRHFGQFTDNTERLRLAHLEVELRQWLAEAAPIVRFSKYAAREDNKLGLIKGSTVELALDEAEQLARDLLLLVTVARTDNPGGHRG